MVAGRIVDLEYLNAISVVHFDLLSNITERVFENE